MGILNEIIEHKRTEIAHLPQRDRPERWRTRRVPDVLRRPRRAPLRIIAEIKPRSPSAGVLSTAMSISERAACYALDGARMISVLTDERFFGGSFEHLQRIRDEVPGVPLLCKDFILDASQVRLAWACGADAVLLIARCLTPEQLQDLTVEALTHDIEPVIEVATAEELEHALTLKPAQVIGINARDLDTLEINNARAFELLRHVPDDRVAILLSGLRTPSGVEAAARSGADAVLIGEALMREDDPSTPLRQMVAASRVI